MKQQQQKKPGEKPVHTEKWDLNYISVLISK